MVAREGSAELRQEGEDSRAFTPAPTSLILYIVKIKSREARAERNIHVRSKPSQGQAAGFQPPPRPKMAS